MSVDWITYEERLPKEGEWGLVWSDMGMAIGEWDNSRNQWWRHSGRNSFEHNKICSDSHVWFPIPNPKLAGEKI